MSYIIGTSCVGVCDTACVHACPVDCIHGPIYPNGVGKEVKLMAKEDLQGRQLYINPNDCINCGACLPECPVDAIFETEQDAINADQTDSVKKNYSFFGLTYQ